jgi:hypothetical protein
MQYNPLGKNVTTSVDYPSFVLIKEAEEKERQLTDGRRGGRRLSFETSFDSKQPKLEPKLVSALSETKRLFRLFRFYTKTV